MNKTYSKNEIKQLKKQLMCERKGIWPQMTDDERKEAMDYAVDYIRFLSEVKTEREAVRFISEMAIKNGFESITSSKAGTKILWQINGKVAALIHLGKQDLLSGFHLIASHIDAPRLDLKQNPLYEELDMAYLKTHYYGGIKKFQWLARPLAIHGVVLTHTGKTIEVVLGEQPSDPVFAINDLLPHLAGKVQADKKLSEAIPAEKLNVIFGGLPILGPEDMKEAVKLHLLQILHQQYGITEEDFISAEIEITPAGPARDVGLDRAFVGGYGQDDRICAYTSMTALLTTERPTSTCIALFMDKEEIGSDGNTGAKSRILELLLYDLLHYLGKKTHPDTLLQILRNSRAISADVTAGVDPDYQEVHEKRNDALMGYGICLTKYTGSRGKYGANDAHAEYVNWIRRTWNQAKVIWQAGELGKVDEGGGGTVAKYLAYHGMSVVDAGPPLLSMHSPFEIAHKADILMSHKAYQAFYKGSVKG
jgi:aspartyl aminopeptidase